MSVYLGGSLQLDRSVNVPAIPAHQNRWVTVDTRPVFLRPGCILKLEVDSTHVVPESNENDNRFTWMP